MTSVIIKFYPTGNAIPRWREVRELYRLNRGRLGCWRSLVLALRGELVMLRECPRTFVMDNSGFTLKLGE